MTSPKASEKPGGGIRLKMEINPSGLSPTAETV